MLPKLHHKLPKSHTGPIYTLKFSHSGEYCMSGSEDRGVCLYNPKKNILVKVYKNLHNYEVTSIDISNDNSRFITGGGDRVVLLTDVLEGKNISRFQGHAGRVNSVAYNEENNVIVSGSYDTTIRCWDNRLGAHSPIDVIKGFKDSVSKVVVSRHQIVASSIDGYVRVFDIRKGEEVEDYFKEPVVSFALSNDTKTLAASCTNSKMYLLERSTGVKLKEYSGHVVRDFSIDVRFTPDDAHMITGSQDGHIYVYNILKGQFVGRINCESRTVSALDLHPKGGLVTGSHEGSLVHWTF